MGETGTGLYRSNPPASPAKMWPKIPLIVAVFVTASVSQTPDQCNLPPNVAFAELTMKFITQQNFFVNNIVYYQCIPGYIWNNSTPDFIKCQPNLNWSELLISCKPKVCGDPLAILDGYYTVTGRSIGHKVTYYCNKGYELLGKRNALCTNNGWSKMIPECSHLPSTITTTISTMPETTPQTNYITTDGAGRNHSLSSFLGLALLDNEEQLSTNATTISTKREATPQTNYITMDGADRNHSLLSFPGYLPSTITTTISTMPETTPQTNYITTDGAGRNHSLSSFLGYLPSTITTTVSTMPETTPQANYITTDGAGRNHSHLSFLGSLLDNEEQLSTNATTISTKREATPQTNYITMDGADRNHSLLSFPGFVDSSYEYWKKWIYLGVIPCAIVVIVILIIKVICDRRKYGSYKTGSQVLEYHKDTELATIKLISN
uniref:complement decay-accelerating factor-like isoform X2 n=1 Tax=Pristiophorus japonicus TaxID=55135 RepID=UPI00398E48DB